MALRHSLQLLSRCFSTKPFTSIPMPPQLPLIGTLQDFGTRVQNSGVWEAVQSYYREYGSIVLHDFMGQKDVWIFHPDDCLTAYREEGQYPSSITAEGWPTQKYNEDRKQSLHFLFLVGPEWQEGRRKVQRDMFPPAAAESYLPLLDEPVRLASLQFPKVPRIDQITPYAATDMFFTMMLGRNPRTVLGINGNVNKEADEIDLEFVQEVMTWLSTHVVLFTNPAWTKTNPGPLYAQFETAAEKVFAKNDRYLNQFLQSEEDKIKSKKEDTVKPYFRRLFDRQELTKNELSGLFSSLLGAGVDTTNHVLIWLFLHLSQNPEKQKILRNELKRVIGDGPLQVEHLRQLPYMHQCIRESFRLAPISAFSNYRRCPKDIELSGYHIPKDTKITLCLNQIQKDPKYVDDADKFIPERWSLQAVESRKGTSKEILDHKLLSKPFGYGQRMCIGSRLAELEIKALLARVVRDWCFEESPPNQSYKLVQGILLKPVPCPTFKWQKV